MNRGTVPILLSPSPNPRPPSTCPRKASPTRRGRVSVPDLSSSAHGLHSTLGLAQPVEESTGLDTDSSAGGGG
eukprot:scaffold1724_cov341-Pavlova_lutheri.AAC.21